MIKVYQSKTIVNDGLADCFNACIGSLLELPLRSMPDILPDGRGSWLDQWKIWLAEKGYKLSMFSLTNPPKGYSIATVYTDRVYPKDHKKAGLQITHSCVAFDGEICHDPYPLPTLRYEVKYFTQLKKLNQAEIFHHKQMMEHGSCPHGYKLACGQCK